MFEMQRTIAKTTGGTHKYVTAATFLVFVIPLIPWTCRYFQHCGYIAGQASQTTAATLNMFCLTHNNKAFVEAYYLMALKSFLYRGISRFGACCCFILRRPYIVWSRLRAVSTSNVFPV